MVVCVSFSACLCLIAAGGSDGPSYCTPAADTDLSDVWQRLLGPPTEAAGRLGAVHHSHRMGVITWLLYSWLLDLNIETLLRQGKGRREDGSW